MASKIITSFLPELGAVFFGRKKPSMVTVNLTNRCDQNCIYCEIGQGVELQKEDMLTAADLKWIIDQMAFHKIPKISLCGGEPFLFRDIIEVVSYAEKNKVRCSVTTNGMTAYRLSDGDLDILKSSGTEVNVSVDSFNEEIQSLTRGSKPALSNAMKSIRRLQGAGVPVTVLTAISRFNYHELSGFVARACENGIRQVLFQPLIFASNYPGTKPVDQKPSYNVPAGNVPVLLTELKKILAYERNHPVKTNVYRIMPWIQHYLENTANRNGHMFFERVVNKFYCREIDAIIDISFDGGIQPCGLAEAKTNIFDNRHPGLIALWQEATSSLKERLAGENYPAICNSCCHHFSRNMIASLMKYPIRNSKAALIIAPLMLDRLAATAVKRLKFKEG
jgi:MoaA/NifB/PqqE/SkfB family radical SAM enzyme